MDQVPRAFLDTLRAVHNDDDKDLDVAGVPLLSPRDPRWTFKLNELDRLREVEF